MTRQVKREKSQKRYPEDLKRKIAKSYLLGEASYAVLAEENGLKNKGVVKEFVKWYRRQLELEPNFDLKFEESENSNILSEKELQNKVKELEKKLKRAELKTEMLETIIDIAEDEFNLDIRKKSGAKQLKK